MKQSQNPRRSRGHRGGRRPGQQGRNTNFESNGPDGKIRGNAHQVIEKYQALGRDALTAGDRIAAENYFQHAEHYFRVMNANGGDAKAKQQQGNGAWRGNGQDEAARPAESAAPEAAESAEAAEATEVASSLDNGESADAAAEKEDAPSGKGSDAPSDEGLMRALGEGPEDDQPAA